MSYESLESCLIDLEAHGHLIRIKEEIDPHLEMAAIHLRVYEAKGPALLFEKVKGSKFRAASNIFGTIDRSKFIFRDTLALVQKMIDVKGDPMKAIKHPLDNFKTGLAAIKALPLKNPSKQPIFYEEIKITDLPLIQHWPMDGGAFITLPQVYSEDIDAPGIMKSNLGMYRIQLTGNDYIPDKEIGLHYQLHRGIGVHQTKANKLGKSLKVSCFVGGPPAHTVAAVMPLPEGIASIVGFDKLDLQIANPNTGILVLFAISSLSVYGIILAGWSSNNKYSLMGGIRSTAQMISYELPLGLSVVAVIMMSGSLKLTEINDAQKGMWFVFTLPGFFAFYLFSVSMFAETNRNPFDLAEAESELVVGFHTEYGAFKFALFFIAEYMNMITMSAVVSLLFFGGYNVPFGIAKGTFVEPLLGLAFFLVKLLFFAFTFMWVRWTLPRFRYDQLMALGWKKMVPFALFNILLTATYVVYWGKYWKGLFN